MRIDPLFHTLDLPGGLTLRNRVVMAPMTTYSADPDGTLSDAELSYYRARAEGPGILVTGCTHVTADGVGFIEEFAGYDDRFVPSLAALAQAAKSGGGAAVLQIFHAGDKALPERTPDGDVVSSSAHIAPPSQQGKGGTMTRELTENEIWDIVRAFGETTRRAVEAGFDGVELHGAHGFLLQNFLSPAVNTRTDAWGGSPGNRARFPREVVREVRRVARELSDRPFVIGYRISLEEPGLDDGLRAPEALLLVDQLIIDGSIDYIHASQYDAMSDTSVDAPEVALVKRLVEMVNGRVAVLSAGGFLTPDQARRGLDAGLDAVVVGRGLVMEPRWVQLAADGNDTAIHTAVDPTETAAELEVPQGLHDMIAASPGWFPSRPRSAADAEATEEGHSTQTYSLETA